MKVCTCNNCGNIFEDLNSSNESIEYKDLPIAPLELLNEDNESYFGCGICQTDAYLVDNINYHAMTEKQKTDVNYQLTTS